MKQDTLYELIDTLDKNEISFFKKYVKFNSKSNAPGYFQLFEHYLKDKNFNESKYRKQIGSSFSIYKNKLFDKLIYALHQYHCLDDNVVKAIDYINVASVVARKQRFDIAEQIIYKADKFIEDHPAFTPHLFTNHFKMLIERSPHRTASVENAKGILDNMKVLTQSYLIHHELNYLLAKVSYLSKKEKLTDSKNHFKEIEDNEYVKNYKEIKNPFDRLNALKLNYFVAEFKNDFERSYELKVEELSYIKQEELVIKRNPMNYLVVLHNIIQIAITLKKFNEATLYLEDLRNAAQAYDIKPDETLQTAIDSYSIPLTAKLNAAQNKSQTNIDDLNKLRDKLKMKTNLKAKDSLEHLGQYYLSIAYMKLNAYSEAMSLLAVFEFENKNLGILDNYNVSVEILRMICFYELELTDLLSAKIRTLARLKTEHPIGHIIRYFKNLLEGKSEQSFSFNLSELDEIALEYLENYA